MTQEPANAAPRYAVYLAPKPETALWKFGSTVLGYDAASGQEIAGFRLPSMAPANWQKVTARARTYGFHATLKAPFYLAKNHNEQDLIAGLGAFANTQLALEPIVLALTILDENTAGGFLALTPAKPYSALRQLEAASVQALDMFRAPLTGEDISRRNPQILSERQKKYLADYGYPYVLEEFRAHFTLCDRLPEPAKAASELNDMMTGHIGAASVAVDELVLFKQPNLDARFQIIARAQLETTVIGTTVR